MNQEASQPYYYANKQRVDLHRKDDLLAVDMTRLTDADHRIRDRIRCLGQPLRHDILLLLRADVDAAMADAIRQANAEQPVYGTSGLADDTLLVVLPEVRVEDSQHGNLAELATWAQQHSAKATVNSHDRIVVEPDSGKGADALQIANQLHEELGVEMAQARMLRRVIARDS